MATPLQQEADAVGADGRLHMGGLRMRAAREPRSTVSCHFLAQYVCERLRVLLRPCRGVGKPGIMGGGCAGAEAVNA